MKKSVVVIIVVIAIIIVIQFITNTINNSEIYNTILDKKAYNELLKDIDTYDIDKTNIFIPIDRIVSIDSIDKKIFNDIEFEETYSQKNKIFSHPEAFYGISFYLIEKNTNVCLL